MSRTNENVFYESGHQTFAVSRRIVTKLRANNAERTTMLLYFYIVEMTKGPTVRITTRSLLDDLRVDAKTFRAARKQLVDLKVIHVKETSNGIWEYELLSPEGHSLPTGDGYIKFDELSADIVTAYYEDRLGHEALPKDGKDNIAFSCPFCHYKRAWFRVHIEQGDGLNGRFICGNQQCEQKGGMIEIEQLVEKKETGKQIGVSEAAKRVRNFMQSRTAAAERAEAQARLTMWAASEPPTYVRSQIDDIEDAATIQ